MPSIKKYLTEEENRIAQYVYNQAYYKQNREQRIAKQKSYYLKNKSRLTDYQITYKSIPQKNMKRLWDAARRRSLEIKVDFNLEVSDLIPPEICPYMGVPITHISGQGYVMTNASLDRIDSTKGYTKGNVRVISWMANKMKQNATEEQLIAFAKGVLRIHDRVTSN